MKKIFIILFLIVLNSFASNKESLMNDAKSLINKEEHLANAINRYILQTGKIPKKSDGKLDFQLLKDKKFLDSNFNSISPFTKKELIVNFNQENSSAFIVSMIEKEEEFKDEFAYLYDFYTNSNFRLNTIPANIKDEKTKKANLLKGTQIVYGKVQKDIVNIINKNIEKIVLENEDCTKDENFYELINGKLIYKYCKKSNIDNEETSRIEVYQESPIILDDVDDLKLIKANIGDIAFVKEIKEKNEKKYEEWSEYYFHGEYTKSDESTNWTKKDPPPSNKTYYDDIGDQIANYIPKAKDLVLRRDGGCYLANGDIYCWGNNRYKRAGIESYGQLDTTLKADYVNTPVMLKVQIEDTEQNAKRWYNNPYRIKFEKMSMNSTNVCGISPIFNYFENNQQKKFGGDLYCNGQITQLYFENVSTAVSETSILGKNKFFGWGKSDKTDDAPKTINVSEDGGPAELNSSGKELTYERDEIYLTDIVMVEDTIAVLSDTGDIYTIGRNYNGALGIGSSDKFINQLTPQKVKNPNGVLFKKIFALRDIATFGALDSNNYFYIWGERPNGVVYNEPTIVNNSQKFNPNGIFTNSKDFLLKSVNNNYYRTKNDIELEVISEIPSTAISASIYNNGSTQLYTYVDEDMTLKGSNNLLACKDSNGSDCNTTDTTDTTDTAIFKTALDELNAMTNRFNGRNYANFANVSIYQLDTVKTEQFDDFEGTISGWTLITYSDKNFKTQKDSTTNVPVYEATEKTPNTLIFPITERVDPTKILGRFSIGDQSVEKTYNFGTTYANNEVEIELDFYEIDSWDMERFQIILNGIIVSEDGFIHDCHQEWTETNDTGIYTLNLGTHYNLSILYCSQTRETYSKYNDEKYTYKFKGKLDASGNLKVEFRVRELKSSDYWSDGQELLFDESWAIDNVRIKVKETNKIFVCAMTGMGASSQMYCWGNVARSLPILNTSLYDTDKISSLNKLFISQESDKTSQMAFDNFNNSGNLFLKYPTYIGGFDYPFYFK